MVVVMVAGSGCNSSTLQQVEKTGQQSRGGKTWRLWAFMVVAVACSGCDSGD